MSHANRNQLWARTLVGELVRAGLRTVCVAPGSRSTPLVLACAEAPELDVLSHLDERSAAFFALGVGRATGAPAAVVTTSGTAVANLFPAVVEASASEAPLLLLTADRPPHLRGADANQAVDQIRIFGSYVREFHELEPPRVDGRSLRHLRVVAARAVASASGAPAGPVHLNVPFEKPLEPTPVPGEVTDEFLRFHPRASEGRGGSEPYVRITRRRSRAEPADVEAISALLAGASRGLVVAGPSSEPGRTGRAARRLAGATGFPLLADPLSGARYASASGVPTVDGYDLLLREPRVRELLRPEVVVRVGASPTSASLARFLEDECAGARQVVVDDGHRYKDHLAVVHDYVRADPAAFLDVLAAAVPENRSQEADAWRRGWERMDDRVRDVVRKQLEGEPFEAGVLVTAAGAVPEGGCLFVSNSMPVRDLDSFVHAGTVQGRIRVFGNRGASGIDGIVSTALGVSRGVGGPVTAVVGDLALLHDANGLAAARRHRGQVTFVVVNNDGGGIFHMLPVRAWDPPFEDLVATPHGLELSRLAGLYDLPYHRAGSHHELADLLEEGSDDGGSRILEVESDRETNRRRHREVETAVRTALIEKLGESE